MRAAAAATLRAVPRVAVAVPVSVRLPLALALVAAASLAGLYLAVLRDLPLVAVERVTVTGLTTRDAPRLRESIVAAGRGMTTLHVRRDRLEGAVAAYPVVRALEVSADFPHGLSVHVVEHRPVALVGAPGGRLPVASDGSVLRGLSPSGRLPTIALPGALPPERIAAPAVLGLLRVAGAAPPALRQRLGSVRHKPGRGVVVTITDGPALIFGSLERVRAKWAAAAAVLADEGSRGASYVDLRLPERPAAGGLPVEAVRPLAEEADSGTLGPERPSVGAINPQVQIQTTPKSQAGVEPYVAQED